MPRTNRQTPPATPFNLRLCLAESKLTLAELVERSGISDWGIRQLLRDDANPKWATIVKLSAAFGMNVVEFVQWATSRPLSAAQMRDAGIADKWQALNALARRATA